MQGKSKPTNKKRNSSPHHESLSGKIKLVNNLPKSKKHQPSNEETQQALNFRKLKLGGNRCVINNEGKIVGLCKSRTLAGVVSMEGSQINRNNSKKPKHQKLDSKNKQCKISSPRCINDASTRLDNLSIRKSHKSKEHSQKKSGRRKIKVEKVPYDEYVEKVERQYEIIANRDVNRDANRDVNRDANRDAIANEDANYSRIYDIDSARDDRSVAQSIAQNICVAELTEQIKGDIEECLLQHRHRKPTGERQERKQCIGMLSRICEVIRSHKSTYALSVELMEGGKGKMWIQALSSLIIALKIDDTKGIESFCDQFLMSAKSMRRSKRSVRVDGKALHTIQNREIDSKIGNKIGSKIGSKIGNKMGSQDANKSNHIDFRSTLISAPQGPILTRPTSMENLVEGKAGDAPENEQGSKLWQQASTTAIITKGTPSRSFKQALINRPDFPHNSMFRPEIFTYYQRGCKDIISFEHVLNEELNLLFAYSFRVALKTTVYYLDSLSLLWDRYLSQLSQEYPSLLFRSKDTLNHSSTFQLLQIHNLEFPDPHFHPKHIRVLSAMYLMVRVRLESGRQCREQEVGMRAVCVREAFARSPNALFCGGTNAIFGSYLQLLGLSLADLMQCIKDEAQYLSRAIVMRHYKKSRHVHNIAMMDQTTTDGTDGLNSHLQH